MLVFYRSINELSKLFLLLAGNEKAHTEEKETVSQKTWRTKVKFKCINFVLV